LLAVATPATEAEILNVAVADDERLQIVIELTTACVAAGTVYRSVSVVADGADCPSTL
jgi:hypothetical protein